MYFIYIFYSVHLYAKYYERFLSYVCMLLLLTRVATAPLICQAVSVRYYSCHKFINKLQCGDYSNLIYVTVKKIFQRNINDGSVFSVVQARFVFRSGSLQCNLHKSGQQIMDANKQKINQWEALPTLEPRCEERRTRKDGSLFRVPVISICFENCLYN